MGLLGFTPRCSAGSRARRRGVCSGFSFSMSALPLTGAGSLGLAVPCWGQGAGLGGLVALCWYEAKLLCSSWVVELGKPPALGFWGSRKAVIGYKGHLMTVQGWARETSLCGLGLEGIIGSWPSWLSCADLGVAC